METRASFPARIDPFANNSDDGVVSRVATDFLRQQLLAIVAAETGRDIADDVGGGRSR